MRGLLSFAAIAALVFATGCETPSRAGSLVRGGKPIGEIHVVNNTAAPVDILYINACGTPADVNRLSPGASIAPGAMQDFQVSEGCWDVDSGVIGRAGARARVEVTGGRATVVALR